jgi:anti-anti-sigma factor
MFASTFDSRNSGGTVRVVPATDGIVAVCLEGEFDIANVSVLTDELGNALAGDDDLILDLSETTFIDSSIIQALFNAVRAASGRDQTLVLQLGTAPIVERALELVGIEGVVARAHDRDEAVRMIQRQADAV